MLPEDSLNLIIEVPPQCQSFPDIRMDVLAEHLFLFFSVDWVVHSVQSVLYHLLSRPLLPLLRFDQINRAPLQFYRQSWRSRREEDSLG